MNLTKISIKNIFRHKRRSFMLIGAIAFSALIMVFLNCFTGGLSYNVKTNYSTKFQGHIYIRGNYINRETSENEILKAIEDSGTNVKYIVRKNTIKGNLIGNSRTVYQEIIGVDYIDPLNIVQGEVGGDGTIVLSESLGEKLDVTIGEYVTVLMNTDTGQVNVEDFILTGLIKDEMDGDYFAYIGLEDSGRLLNMDENEYQSFNIYLENMEEMKSSANDIYNNLKDKLSIISHEEKLNTGMISSRSGSLGKNLGRLRGRGFRGGMIRERSDNFIISTLEDNLANILDIVKLINSISKGIFIVLILITMVGISNTFRMIILERTSEIGTIRAVGMKKRHILTLFQSEALFTALIGISIGIIVSGILMKILGYIPLAIPEYQEFLYMGNLTFKPQITSLFLSLILLTLFSNIAALRSAFKGANLKPVDALRYNL